MKRMYRSKSIFLLMLLIGGALLTTGCMDDEEGKKESKEGLLPDGSGPKLSVQLRMLEQQGSINLSDITEQADKLTEINSTSSKGEKTTYVGIDLYDLLIEFGVKWGAGDVKVEATDGYSYTFDFFDLYYGPAKRDEEIVMLAIVGDGKWLEEGAMIVAPSYPGQAGVKRVSKITVTPWKLRVNGSVSQELDIDVTDFEDAAKYTSHTFTAAVPDKGSNEYTGVAVSDILTESGITVNATGATVRVYAHDGYFVDFTYSDMMDNPESANPIILAYKMNDEYIPFENGALMLVAPDDEYSGDDTNWFMNVWSKCVVGLEII